MLSVLWRPRYLGEGYNELPKTFLLKVGCEGGVEQRQKLAGLVKRKKTVSEEEDHYVCRQEIH